MAEGEGQQMDCEESDQVVLPGYELIERNLWNGYGRQPQRILDKPELDTLTMYYEKIQELEKEKEELLKRFEGSKTTIRDAMQILDVQVHVNEATPPVMGHPPPVADPKKKSSGDFAQLKIQLGELGRKLELRGKVIDDLVEAVGKVHEKLDAVILGSRMSSGEVESPSVPSSSSAIDPLPILADSNNIDQLVEDERDEDLDKEAVERRTGSSAITEMDTIIDEQTAMNVVRTMVLGKAHRKLAESIIGSRMSAMEVVEFPNIPSTSPSPAMNALTVLDGATNIDQLIEDGRDDHVDYEAVEGRSESSGVTGMDTIIGELTAIKAVRALTLPKTVLRSSGAINGATIPVRSRRIEHGQDDAKNLENGVIERRYKSSSGMDIINKLRIMNLPRNRWR